MLRKTIILRFLFALFVILQAHHGKAQIQRTYLINNPAQLGTNPYPTGCGSNYWSDDFFVGFHWNDDLPAGCTITGLTIETNIGIEYIDWGHFTLLNGSYAGDMFTTPFYDCNDRTFIAHPDAINPADYIVGGFNEFIFNAEWGATCISRSPDLNGAFARVTVSYFPPFTGINAPSISAFTPGTALPCTDITISGANFTNHVSHVLFNGIDATAFTVLNDGMIQATIPPLATDGPISVYNEGGYVNSDDPFIITVPNAPVISNVTPNSGLPGTPISITGTDLCCIVSLTVGGTPVSSYTIVNPGLITAQIGYGSTGNVDLTTPGGTASFGSFTYIEPPASSHVTVSGSDTTGSVIANVPTIVDSALVVSSNGLINGFTVSISDTYTDGDVLDFDGILPYGITTNGFDSRTGVIVFNGALMPADWQTLLRQVTFTSTSSVCFPEKRKISFTAGNKYYNPLNGHFYEYVQNALTWSDARNASAASSYYGRQGYLATVTTVAENNYIWKVMSASAWLGGSDNFNEINTALDSIAYPDAFASEGKYFWVTGPEKGMQFSEHNAYEDGGVQSYSGRYHNWSEGEPNDYPDQDLYTPGQEDYLQIYAEFGSNGTWNDLPNGSGLFYLIEYGGMPGDILSDQVVFTRELSVSGSSSGTITGGNVNVCEGSNSTTLTLTNFDGFVEYWEYSADNFLTPGTPIFDNSTSITVTDISSTTYYRAIVSSNSPAACSSLNTASVKIGVTQTLPGSVTAQNNVICQSGTADLTLFGNAGSVLYWEMSSSADFSAAVPILDTNTHIQQVMPDEGSFYFRALVQNSGCGSPLYSIARMITVNSGTPPLGGAVSSDEHIYGSFFGTLTLTGYTGTIEKWQQSVNDGLTWTDISNTNDTYNYLTASNTRFRAVVSNSGCGNANSEAGVVSFLNFNEYKWYGYDNTDWATNNNWLDASKPTSGADVIISPTAINDLILDQDYELNSIDFSGSDKSVDLNDHDLTVSQLISGNQNSFVKTSGTGKLKVQIATNNSFLFPVGRTAYNPVRITNNTGSDDVFSVKVLDEVYANGSSGLPENKFRVQRTWDISKATPNGGSGLDLMFYWNDGELSGPMSIPALFHHEGSWVKQTGITFSGSNSLSYVGYTGTFSPFSVMDGSTTLPVTWLSFTARKQNTSVAINWSTATEQGTSKFTVQHSVNGIDWHNLGTRTAAGFSSLPQAYSFIDDNPASGANFYRLIQHDIDGRQSYSKVLRLNFDDLTSHMLLYPNPVTDGVLNVRLDKSVSLEVFNSVGARVMQKEMQAGVSTLDLSRLPKGVYNIRAGEETASIIIR